MHQNKKNFIDGLQLILDKWTALQLSIEMEWGGPDTAQKATDLHFSLVDYFEKEGKNLEPEDVEDILLDVMRDEFGAVLEDESEREVAKSIFKLYKESVKGETSFLESLRKRPTSTNVLEACKGEIQDIEASDNELACDMSGSDEELE